MAEQDHEMAEGDGRGRLRASHADRERVIDRLKAAYVYGLVTKDEFDERVSQAFAARTYAELPVLTADVRAVLRGDQLTVVVSPDVAPASLAFLSSDVALAVADAVDRKTGNAAERP
jgi:Domain of unknown function (DUF1707)